MEDEDVFTVHPFDDEWVWDPGRSGSHPWATGSLEDAITHANLVRLEYAIVEGANPEFLAGFWSAIYDESNPEKMIGWVDPQGNYTEGALPPINEAGGWVGLQAGDSA